MIEKPALSVADKLIFVYYMNLQDRVEDSLALFNSIKANEIPEDNTLRI